METIHVTKDEALVDEDSLQDYVDLLNGIVYDCSQGGYCEGNRNEIAVCLTVGAYSLGLDPLDVLDKLIKENVIDPRNDDEDPATRVRTIMDYERRFDWDWMLNPDYYAGLGGKMLTDKDFVPKVLFSL